jgi:hypothetical protein
MTIEAEIQKLTTAITELTAAIYGSAGVARGGSTPSSTTSAEVASAEVASEEKPKTEKKEVKPKAEKAKPAATPVLEPEVTEYPKVRDKVLDLIKTDPNNRAKVLTALSEFGVTTAKDLKPEQYTKALEALNNIKE